MSCYYDILGVNKNDTQQTIKKAWKKLACIYHPDKGNIKDENKMKEINEAYSILGNSEKRSLYDKYGKEGTNSNFMQNIFKHSPNIPPIQSIVELTLEELYLGKKIHVEYERKNVCEICHGTGSKNRIPSQCDTCKGNKFLIHVERKGIFSQQRDIPCPRCSGTGIKPGTIVCESCNGSRDEIEICNHSIQISAGMYNGYKNRNS